MSDCRRGEGACWASGTFLLRAPLKLSSSFPSFSSVGVEGRVGVWDTMGVAGTEGTGVTGNLSLVGSMRVKYIAMPFVRITRGRKILLSDPTSAGENRP